MSSGENTTSLTNNGLFDFWGGGWVSLEDRWGMTGRLLQEKARQVYLLPGKEHMTLPWFDDEGKELYKHAEDLQLHITRLERILYEEKTHGI